MPIFLLNTHPIEISLTQLQSFITSLTTEELFPSVHTTPTILIIPAPTICARCNPPNDEAPQEESRPLWSASRQPFDNQSTNSASSEVTISEDEIISSTQPRPPPTPYLPPIPRFDGNTLSRYTEEGFTSKANGVGKEAQEVAHESSPGRVAIGK
jgi:hypothetical protein